jgi:excisionase family DNA binding protein
MNKKEAAEHLGVSTRLVEQYASQGRLGEVKYVRGKTGKQAEYDEQSVERLKAELESPDYSLVPAAQSHASGLLAGQDRERLIVAIEALAQSREQTRAGLIGLSASEKIMLTLADASALSSLSQGHLTADIHSGKLKAKKIGRGWKIKRSDLDAYVKKL